MKKQINIRINKQLQMLCAILEVSPEEVLQQFADNLSLDSKYTSSSDERSMAVEYFMRCGYGMHIFTFDEIETMFDQLNAIRLDAYHYGNQLEWFYLQNRRKQFNALLKHWSKLKTEKKREV